MTMTAEELKAAKKTVDDASDAIRVLAERLARATALLRDWRDKYAGKEVHAVRGIGDRLLSASQTDLARETQRFLEGR